MGSPTWGVLKAERLVACSGEKKDRAYADRLAQFRDDRHHVSDQENQSK